MQHQDGLVRVSRWVVRIGLVVNRLFAAGVCCLLVLSLVFGETFASWLVAAGHPADMRETLSGLRLLMLIGLATAVATDRLLAGLLGMIDSVRFGDPFVAANARRLRMIGWALLALQLLDIAATLLAMWFPSLGSAAPSGDISVGGWVAVLMVFVLSRVFAAGSAMRDELEATV